MVQKWLRIAALSALAIASAHARNILLISSDPSRPVGATLVADPLAYGTTFNINPAAFAILPTNSPERFFIVSGSAAETVQIAEGQFPSLAAGSVRIPTGIEARAAAAGLGGRVLVVAGRGGVAIVDAQSNSVTGTFPNQAGTDPVDVAVSIDGTRAFVLSAAPSQITVIDLQTRAVAGSISIPAAPTAIAVGPNGLLYVSANGAVFEVDGNAQRIRATFSINGQPDRLQFTPDGRRALARNMNAVTARAAFVLDLVARRVSEAVSATLTFTDVQVVGNNLAYAVGSQGLLYAITLAGSEGQVTWSEASLIGGNTPVGIREMAATGETPSSRRLIVRAENGIFTIDPATNATVSSIVLAFSGSMYSFTGSGSGPVITLVGFGTSQTVPAGSSSAPLVARVLDQNGLPLAGVPVTFTTTAAGVTLSAAQAVSNPEGYAAINSTLASSATGANTITASAGGRTATFTVTVGADPGTGGGTGTPVQTGLVILQGQGQVVNAFEAGGEPLRVRLLDAQGRPVPNAEIRWQVLAGGSGNLLPSQTTTNENGEAESLFRANALTPAQFSLLNRIEATGPQGQTALFFITSLPVRDALGGLEAFRLAPVDVITGRSGDIIPGAIQFAVAARPIGTRLSNVGLSINNVAGSTTTARCVGPSGYALSNEQGIVSCDLQLSGAPGEVTVEAVIGGTRRESITIRVLQGLPASIRAEVPREFNNMNPGQRATLIVTVTDAGGNPVPGTTVQWEAPAGGSVQRAQTTTDAQGRTDNNADAPMTPGQHIFRARAGNAVLTFTFNVVGAVGRTEVVGGNNQSAAVGQRFGSAISVRVLDAQGQPMPNAPVTFRVTQGNATLSRESATTDAQGVASVDVTAGNTTGNVVVTATSGQSIVTFNLAVRAQGPQFTAGDIVNVAGFQAGISPGSLAMIRVRGIASDLRGSTVATNIVGPWPMRLAGVEVLFNDIPAPVYAVNNINGEETVVVQVPFEIQPGFVTVTVRSASGGSTTVANVEVRRVSPGLFTFMETNGQVYAVATRPDGSYVTSQNPARRGERIRVYASGLGQTNATAGTNRAGIGNQIVTLPVIVGVNHAGVPGTVTAELVSGLVGVYSVSFEVPMNTPTGMSQPVVIAVETGADTVFSNTASLPIQ